jgi:hypothetical protein
MLMVAGRGEYLDLSEREGRSQWKRGMTHEPSSPAQALGAWVRISLKAWMSVCAYSLCVVLCVDSGFVTG